RPRWENVEAVVGLFDDEEFAEWTADFPDFPDPRDPLDEAIEKAKKGDLADLIRLAREGRRKKKSGRPPSRARRTWKYPVHKAAFMVPEAKWILRHIYPDQPSDQIRDRALMVVERMTGVGVETIKNYLARSRKNRRRLV